MKYLFSFLSFLFSFSFLSAQDRNENASSGTFAVIIGIANYENENIKLNYANKDAEVFAEYLKSKAGGAVPEDNIRLLIDQEATTAAIYNALKWLRDKCDLYRIENNGQPAKVYFYFSGHGDVEIDTKANLGFLIAFNTPPNNYINNAVRIEDLNNYAHTLSVDLDADVVIITDACHSGKLAGSDNKGSFLVGKELSTAREKEIRIASCNPDELSNEDERWGGGRGVFSYYLVNGLKGLADKNNDNYVTLSEIKNYVDSSIAADAVLKETRKKQTPVLEGNKQFKLAAVDREGFIEEQKILLLKSSSQTPEDLFFNLIRNSDKLEEVDYKSLDRVAKNNIAVEFVNLVEPLLDSPVNYQQLEMLRSAITSDSKRKELFNERLVELLHTRGQKLINAYLEGDEAEMERRRYYNVKGSGYDAIPAMYNVALKLTGPENPLSRILEVNRLYFTGVIARMKLPLVSSAQQKVLLNEALAVQTKAIALEPNAAYIQNELGILNYYKGNNKLAEEFYRKSAELSPSWSVPWANLCGLYAGMNDSVQSLSTGRTAEQLQPGSQLVNTNLGRAYEVSGNLLFAEEYYRKAIDINSRHYLPFERLGYVYMNTTSYAMADSFFYEADLRKRGYNFNGSVFMSVSPMIIEGPEAPFDCEVDTNLLAKDDILGFFTWGVKEYDQQHYTNAERILRKVIKLDPNNPLVFHYMGKLFYDQQQWEGAEVMFLRAVELYLDEDAFANYCDSLKNAKQFPYPHECFEQYFKYKYYRGIEDHYFLGKIYESWTHFEKAEKVYRSIIETGSTGIEPYIKLWQMLEHIGRYTEAEETIKAYAVHDKLRSDIELNAFYRRTIERLPDNPDWSYRLGLFLYTTNSMIRATYLDTIIWFPNLNKEIFIDTSHYFHTLYGLSLDLKPSVKSNIINIAYVKEHYKSIVIPGTKENIGLAEAIYTPRKDAIRYFLKADSLLTDPVVKADINFKVGNLFVRAGSNKQAYPYYVRSVDLDTTNADARLNLVDAADALYKNRAGLENMEYLFNHQQINFPKRMLYAEYSIHKGDVETGRTLLDEAERIYPYILPEAFDLRGRSYLLSHQPKDAIKWYHEYLNVYPDDAFTSYTLAKLYTQTGDSKRAWEYLEVSMKNGFNYPFILRFDDAWKNYRSNAKWKMLLKKYPPMEYYYPPDKK